MREMGIGASEISAFAAYLQREEKSRATVAKYMSDVERFVAFVGGRDISKEIVLDYKGVLERCHAATGANAVLAAVNSFLRFLGKGDCCVRQFRVQRRAYRAAERELTKAEYLRLINAAQRQENQRLSLLLQTICGTGIRVSELRCITVEAVRMGEASVSCKSKTRKVFFVTSLRKKLLRYAKEKGIDKGEVFVTATGRSMDRSNIWREMKALCKQAGVSPEKVFPHNLRHLFARTFYGIEKDIAKLADLLGHSSINTTRIYIATTGAEHRRKMENMHLIL